MLVPPLNAAVGAIYFNPSFQVAPMFQPLSGDLILNPSDGRVEIYDSELRLIRRIDVESKTEISLGLDSGLVWSPNGSLILASGTSHDEQTDTWIYRDSVVVDAETGDIRAFLGRIPSGTWSPDSALIAYEDWDSENPPSEARIAIHELATGEVRILESTVSPFKRGASVQTVTNNRDHDWYYEGWSWSPDSKHLIILKDHNTRPIVINVASDTATELPWITDSFPSWQPNT